MKRRVWAVGIAAAAVLGACAAPAQAQFYIGVRGGLSDQSVSQKSDLGKIDFDSDSTFLYGGQIGFKLSALAIEGEFYTADHSLTTSGGTTSAVGVNYYYLGVNGKLGLPLIIVYPYITVGYGGYSADLEGFGKDTDTSWNAGAGVQVNLGKVGIFGEVRYINFSFVLDTLDWSFKGVEGHFGLNIHF